MRTTIRILAITLLLLSETALADGARLVLQAKTAAIPEVEFDEIRVTLWRAADDASLGTRTHVADASRDYEAGVRVAEFRLPAGFDDGIYHGNIRMYLGGGLVIERPLYWYSCCHGHGGSHYPPIVVLTVEMANDFELIASEDVEKSVTLLVDADGTGTTSPGDTLHYTVEFPAPYALSPASSFRDSLDPDTSLLPGTVTTTSGAIVRGNGPSDRSVEVRLGSPPAESLVTIEYDAVITPMIENQGRLHAGITDSRVIYDRVTDDPSTPGILGDPTRLTLSCLPQDVPPTLPTEELIVYPDSVPQFGASYVRISGQGFGTLEGAPTLIVNGRAFETQMLPFSPDFETVEVVIPAEITEQAGATPFTLVPVDPQLPAVKGILKITPAPPTGPEIAAAVRETISNEVTTFVSNGLTALQDARDTAAASPARCNDFRADVLSDLEWHATSGSAAISIAGDVALVQAEARNATPEELDDIRRAMQDGKGLLSSMLRQIGVEARRGNGPLCSPHRKPRKK